MEYRVYEFNKACELAKNIEMHHKNQFLDAWIGYQNHFDGSYTTRIRNWRRLKGFRSMATKEKTIGAAKEACSHWIKGNADAGTELAFVMTRSNKQTGVYYGSDTLSFSSFNNYLPEIELTDEEPVLLQTSNNGFAIGSLSSEAFADSVLSIDADYFYVACIIIPVDLMCINESLREINSDRGALNRFKSYTRTYGTATRRIEEIENSNISQALEALNETEQFFRDYSSEGFAKTIIRFGAQNNSDYEKLLAAIKSCMRVERADYIEPLRAFKLSGKEQDWPDHLSVPEITNNGSKIRLLSIQPIADLKSICIPPLMSRGDYFVKNYVTNEDSITVFESPKTAGKGIPFGKDKYNDTVFLPFELMCCHTAILGSAGGGKTTSVKNILLSLHEQNIPFLVIEAAKKEYFDLSSVVPEMQIYTPGTNGNRLMINPLQPEDGTLIENQVDMLVKAITAAHGGEHPIPEGFEGLLRMTYERAGWDYGTLAFNDRSRPFPTFEDVYRNVDEYVQRHAKYGAENRQNLIAALSLRSENLFSGALGRTCNVVDGLSAKELLSGPTLIELDDFSESSVSFLMNVILFRIQSYLSKQGKSKNLKRVVVVEEAHNVFRKDTGDDHSQDITNRYFEKMLSEIRASGTGLIISDQRPSILSEALMQNTAIKIIHAMEERMDRESVASALDLSEIQLKKLRELIPGECILGMRGRFGLSDVFVNKPDISDVHNVFCTSCPRRFECTGHGNALDGIGVDDDRIRHFVEAILSSPYNLPFVRRYADYLMEELKVKNNVVSKCCALGELLNKYGEAPTVVRRIVVETYYNSLRKEVAGAK